MILNAKVEFVLKIVAIVVNLEMKHKQRYALVSNETYVRAQMLLQIIKLVRIVLL